MMTQSKALWYAEWLESAPTSPTAVDAAAELRRLHAENERLRVDGIHSCHVECQRPVCRLTRERDALLPVALAVDAHYSGSLDYKPAYVALAREAIKAVEDGGQTTHSADCWRWHHKCAVAKIEREYGQG